MMYNFVYSIQKRQQEQKQLPKLLIVSFVGSALFHGMLIVFLLHWFPKQSPVKVKKPIEIILVEKPQPKPIETKVVPKPKPIPPPKATIPEPSKPKPTPPPKAKTPEPPKPQITPPPKREQPRQILTTSNTQTTNSVFNPPAKTETPAITTTRSIPSPPTTEKTVATNSPPPAAPKPTTGVLEISCVANCQPKYPSALNGEEGRAGIRLTIDNNGNVIAAELVRAHSNAMLNRQALLAARRMKFNKINNEAGASVVVNISFTIKGSEFERIARERQAQQERERQAKLEAERQRQEQEAERQRQEQEAARQRQENTHQQQTPTPKPTIPDNQTEQERQEEILRKFRERMNNYQQNK
ncbi:MAG: TonB family protein [Xenococcaceae cyanobacterium]